MITLGHSRRGEVDLDVSVQVWPSLVRVESWAVDVLAAAQDGAGEAEELALADGEVAAVLSDGALQLAVERLNHFL